MIARSSIVRASSFTSSSSATSSRSASSSAPIVLTVPASSATASASTGTPASIIGASLRTPQDLRSRYGGRSPRPVGWNGYASGRLSRTTGHAARSPYFSDRPTASQPSSPSSLRRSGDQASSLFLRLLASLSGTTRYSNRVAATLGASMMDDISIRRHLLSAQRSHSLTRLASGTTTDRKTQRQRAPRRRRASRAAPIPISSRSALRRDSATFRQPPPPLCEPRGGSSPLVRIVGAALRAMHARPRLTPGLAGHALPLVSWIGDRNGPCRICDCHRVGESGLHHCLCQNGRERQRVAVDLVLEVDSLVAAETDRVVRDDFVAAFVHLALVLVEGTESSLGVEEVRVNERWLCAFAQFVLLCERCRVHLGEVIAGDDRRCDLAKTSRVERSHQLRASMHPFPAANDGGLADAAARRFGRRSCRRWTGVASRCRILRTAARHHEHQPHWYPDCRLQDALPCAGSSILPRHGSRCKGSALARFSTVATSVTSAGGDPRRWS